MPGARGLASSLTKVSCWPWRIVGMQRLAPVAVKSPGVVTGSSAIWTVCVRQSGNGSGR